MLRPTPSSVSRETGGGSSVSATDSDSVIDSDSDSGVFAPGKSGAGMVLAGSFT